MKDSEPLEGPLRSWCLFRGADRHYALGLESVAEVIEIDRLVRLPLSPPRVVGICHFRREVVPIIRLIDGASEESPWGEERQHILILRTDQGLWGLRIAPGGTVVGQGFLEGPTPPVHVEEAAPVYLGTVRHGGAVYAVIDPEATWQGARKRVEAWYADEWCKGASDKGELPRSTLEVGA